MSDKTVIR